MTRPPFGFHPSGEGEDDGEQPSGLPGLPDGFPGGIPDLGAMLHQLGDLMSGQTGPVNWQVARQAAMEIIGADSGTTSTDTTEVAEALRLADVWLAPVTTLPSGVTSTEAWSRRRWLEATRPAWTELVEPVAARVSGSMGDALPEEMRAMAGPLMGIMSQVGQALGTLATEVVGSTDIGVPLGPAGIGALLPESIRDLGTGLDVPLDQV